MAAPVIQFKRGVLANLPGLRAGEPGFTTDSYDLYVGIDSTTSNNQFVGSGRYWSVNTATVGSGVKLVEGTDNGTSAITLKAPNSLSGDLTYTMPGTDGSNGHVLVTDGSGNLSFSAPAASTFTLSADSGSDDTFSTGGTLTFTGGTGISATVSNDQISYGLDAQLVDIAGLTPSDGGFIVGDGSNFVVESAATARASLGVDAAGTDNSTDVTLAGNGYLALSGQQITAGDINLASHVTGALPVTNGGTGATSASAARAALGVDAAGTDNSTDVTLAGNNYLSLSGQQITAGNIALTAHVSGVLPISNGGTGGGSAAAARAALGVDAAGTDNSTDVTLAGASYLSLSGQQITANPINLGSQTTGTLPVGSLSANSITVSDGTNSSDVTLGNTVTFAATANETTVVESSGTVTIGLPNDVTVSNDLTVSGNLIVNGSTTQVNTTTTTVDDTLFDLGTVSGSAPTSDVNKDIGVLFNYYSGSAKKAAVYWDDSASRIVVSADVSESSSVLTNSTAAALEIGSLYVNDCAGNSQVINCSGSERTLENITLDGGSF
jgi:hypothetical protein